MSFTSHPNLSRLLYFWFLVPSQNNLYCFILYLLKAIMKTKPLNRQRSSLMPTQSGNVIWVLCSFPSNRLISEISCSKGKVRCSKVTNDLGNLEFQLSIFISSISWKSGSFIYLVALRISIHIQTSGQMDKTYLYL